MTKSELEKKLNSVLEYFKSELTQIHTGRVTPALLDDIKVNAYGSMLGIREVGTIQVLDAQTLQVTPWDKNMLEPLDKAIRISNLGLNPSIRGTVLFVPIPPLTEERRREMAKLVSSKVEDCKTGMRSVRQEAMKDIDQDFANKLFGEDEKYTKKEEVEDTVKTYVTKADDIGDAKKDELLDLGR